MTAVEAGLRIAELVRPGGTLLVAALHRASRYQVGGRLFPRANIDVDDIRAVLEPAFDLDEGAIEVRHVPEHRNQGYEGILLARARRASADLVASRSRPDDAGDQGLAVATIRVLG
jgi:hypothetical protein